MAMLMDEMTILKNSLNKANLVSNHLEDMEEFFTYMYAIAAIAIQKRYPNILMRVIPSSTTIYKEKDKLYESFSFAINEVKELSEELSSYEKDNPEGFGKVKYHLDLFFFAVTEKGNLEYTYTDDYIISVEDSCKYLDVTRPTINKYMRMGLEQISTTKHKKIPIHAVMLWKDPEWLTNIQTLHGMYIERNKTLQDEYREVLLKIKEFEQIYDGQPFNVVYSEVLSGKIHWDETESPSDYLLWESLEEEREKLEKGLGI
ncbi:hypothetical protein [Priestia megaterium]|uniref:hypothetical protein n=1 Tax=Priestia megaterium TaxID=1404 RepID=UPI00159C15E4|nr:hypothetical protein [Priestia megaterium]